jgi:succinate dehydrogenase hydrophobic anchor subunit
MQYVTACFSVLFTIIIKAAWNQNRPHAISEVTLESEGWSYFFKILVICIAL